MKKTFKFLLLAVLVICTVCALTVMAGATEEDSVTVLGEGYVKQYATYVAKDSEENVLNDGTNADNDLYWTVTSDGVLKITGTSESLVLNPGPSWNTTSLIPWLGGVANLKSSITKVVIEAPVNSICGYAFDQLSKCTTVELPADIRIKVGPMTFAIMTELTTLGRTGSIEEGVIDLRNMYGNANNLFEQSSKNKTITVKLDYTAKSGAQAMNTSKVFADTANVTFMVLKGSEGETFAQTIKAKAEAETNPTPYVDVVNIDYYTGIVVEGQESDKNNRNFKWTLDVDSGLLTISKHDEPITTWMQIDFQDANWTEFADAWKNYVKDAVIDYKFGKITLGGSGKQCFLSGSTSLETVSFMAGQRLQNGLASGGYGWFKNCPNLKSVTFGGELVDGVADLSGASITAGQDTEETWLANMFSGCSSIKTIILPTGAAVTTLHASTISGCTALTDIYVGSNITTFEEDAFDAWINSTEGYSELTVTFTEENSEVGLALKEKEAGLLHVVVPATATSGDVSGDANDDNDLKWAFDVATGKLTITGTSDTIVWVDGKDAGWDSTVNNNVFTMIPWHSEYKDVITSVEITAPVTSIPAGMFGELKNLVTVVLPDTCVAYGSMAFFGCHSLKEVQTAGVEVPENVIDLRNFTGKNGGQPFESALKGETTIWLPETAEALKLNYVFGTSSTKAHMVVYPGSMAEEQAYGLVNTPGSRVYGEFSYSYYTSEQDEELGAWTELLTGAATADIAYGIANWTFDIETGIVTVTVTKGEKGSSDCSLTAKCPVWTKFASTFKYAIKQVHFLTDAKLNVKLSNFPELTTILYNGTRLQGSPSFANNPKLTTIGTVAGAVKGTVNLSVWNDMNNAKLEGKILANMFSGNEAMTKVILPGNPYSSYSINGINANAFANCTGLTTLVIPENCSIDPALINADAFSGCKALTVICKDADYDTETLLAVLPEGSYIYKDAASEGEGLARGIVFDGWKVRLEKYNGLRGVLYFDNDVTAANKTAGWDLVEYGAVLSTTTAKNLTGAVVYHNDGVTTTDATTRLYPIYKDGKVSGKTLIGSDVDADTNGTYFAVSIVKYKANFRSDVYIAGYEIWKDASGNIVIMYTDYATDKSHDASFADTNIYDVSMDMYMAGAIDANVDKENIVWDSLVAGGALTLTKDTDYVTTDDYTDGEAINMLTGEAFGDTFTLANVPMVNQSVTTVNDVKTLHFADAGVTYTVLANPDEDNSYVIVYRDNPEVDGTTIPGTSPWGVGYYGQLETGWYPGNTAKGIGAADAVRPNPKFTSNFYSYCHYAIIDYGVTATANEAFKGSGAITYMYSDTFETLGAGAFQGSGSLTTMFKVGTTPVVGRVDVSYLTRVAGTYTFNGSAKIVELKLPENTTISTQFAQGAKSLTTLWLGDDSNRVEGAINLSNGTKITGIGSKALTGIKATVVYLPTACVNIDSAAFNAASGALEFVQQIETPVEAISTYCTEKGYVYTTIAPSAGWSMIIVE